MTFNEHVRVPNPNGKVGEQSLREIAIACRSTVVGINENIAQYLRSVAREYGFVKLDKPFKDINRMSRYVYSVRFAQQGEVYLVSCPKTGLYADNQLLVEECDPRKHRSSENCGLGASQRLVAYRFDPGAFIAKNDEADLVRLLYPGVITYDEPERNIHAQYGFKPPTILTDLTDVVGHVYSQEGLVSVGSAEEIKVLLEQSSRIAKLLISGGLILNTRI